MAGHICSQNKLTGFDFFALLRLLSSIDAGMSKRDQTRGPIEPASWNLLECIYPRARGCPPEM